MARIKSKSTETDEEKYLCDFTDPAEDFKGMTRIKLVVTIFITALISVLLTVFWMQKLS